eukprot:GDKJ01014582.1.p1 GENE.GDKJ01014582.1~~GDKJ01014582.1.p1  ORF type:complete len:735 (+),score=135.53 GDKJ01014582.1:34-2205(+)
MGNRPSQGHDPLLIDNNANNSDELRNIPKGDEFAEYRGGRIIAMTVVLSVYFLIIVGCILSGQTADHIIGCLIVMCSTAVLLLFRKVCPRKPSVSLLFESFALGAILGIFIAIILESTGMMLAQVPIGRCNTNQTLWTCAGKHLFLAVIVIGLTEEMGKASSIFFIRFSEDSTPSFLPSWWRIVRSPSALIACAAAGGMGFSVLENVKYVLVPVNVGEPGEEEENLSAIGTGIMRILVTSPMHVSWTAMVGVALARWVFFSSDGRARGVVDCTTNESSNHAQEGIVDRSYVLSPTSPLRGGDRPLVHANPNTGSQSLPIVSVGGVREGGGSVLPLHLPTSTDVQFNNGIVYHQPDNNLADQNRFLPSDVAAHLLEGLPPGQQSLAFSISERSICDTSHLVLRDHPNLDHQHSVQVQPALDSRVTPTIPPSFTTPLIAPPSLEGGGFDSSKSPGYLIPLTKTHLWIGMLGGLIPAAVLHGLFDFFLMMSAALVLRIKQLEDGAAGKAMEGHTSMNKHAAKLFLSITQSRSHWTRTIMEKISEGIAFLMHNPHADETLSSGGGLETDVESRFMNEIEKSQHAKLSPEVEAQIDLLELFCFLMILGALSVWIGTLVYVWTNWRRVVKYEGYALQDLWLLQRLQRARGGEVFELETGEQEMRLHGRMLNGNEAFPDNRRDTSPSRVASFYQNFITNIANPRRNGGASPSRNEGYSMIPGDEDRHRGA